jgi:hypothetical protein
MRREVDEERARAATERRDALFSVAATQCRASDTAAALAARVAALAASQCVLEAQLVAAEAARARDAASLARLRGETEPTDDGGASSLGLPRAPDA